VNLQLTSNQLTGTIPTELGNLASVGTLGLQSNQLNGTIPSELGTITRLYYLHVNSNQLTGTLASELTTFTKPFFIYACKNAGLCGDIPAGISVWGVFNCSSPTFGTLLGSDCPTSSPTTASPTASPTSAAPTTTPTVFSSPSHECCSVLLQDKDFLCIFEAMGIQQQEMYESWCVSSC